MGSKAGDLRGGSICVIALQRAQNPLSSAPSAPLRPISLSLSRLKKRGDQPRRAFLHAIRPRPRLPVAVLDAAALGEIVVERLAQSSRRGLVVPQRVH